LDTRLLDILVCPICKGPLKHERGGTGADGTPIDGELVCRPDRLAYPIRDGIPVMLVDEARRVEQVG
jgi:uncharacterized protein YbaR (Trm112 family)